MSCARSWTGRMQGISASGSPSRVRPTMTRGGKESVANGLVTIIIEEYDIHTTSTFLT